ncbi:hypothetical protein Pcinc_036813, partial [Petrolisthes cinctipes]
SLPGHAPPPSTTVTISDNTATRKTVMHHQATMRFILLIEPGIFVQQARGIEVS